MNQLNDKLKKIQSNLQTIFNLLKIPYSQKIDSIDPISNELIESHRQTVLNNLKEILVVFQEIKSEKIIQITDFKAFLEKIIPIIKEIKINIEKSQIDKYKNLYLAIQLYWYIEYFIKHEFEFKNNEFFNIGCHYKWIIDDECLDFLNNLEKNPNSSINILTEIDDKRKDTITNIKLINIKDETVELTSLGKILCDLAKIGDIYCYYLDEFDEIFEES
ncbi:MAG: hypothetical protein HWN67_04215 [Candidatus Helarchaeota archaeon]|nr:hypothetical protein [Candidatus Helarchaeota archaeon]